LLYIVIQVKQTGYMMRCRFADRQCRHLSHCWSTLRIRSRRQRIWRRLAGHILYLR